MKDLQNLFSRIPLLQDFNTGDFNISKLPGLTNRNYRLHNQENDWVLRIPRQATNDLVDRNAEAHNQVLARQLGLAPQVIWRDATGLSLTPTLSASRTLKIEDFADPEIVHLCITALQRLHRSGLCFRGRVDLGLLLHKHFELLNKQEQQGFRERLLRAEDLLAKLDETDHAYVASHNDLVLENLLLDDGELCIIDWEYSAMASPYWDLATLCNEARLDRQQSRKLLQLYCIGGTTMQESMLFDYQELLKLLSECWMTALAQ